MIYVDFVHHDVGQIAYDPLARAGDLAVVSEARKLTKPLDRV